MQKRKLREVSNARSSGDSHYNIGGQSIVYQM